MLFILFLDDIDSSLDILADIFSASHKLLLDSWQNETELFASGSCFNASMNVTTNHT